MRLRHFWFTVILGKAKELREDSSAPEEVDLGGLRVLVVDDSPTNRLILSEYLASWGCLSVEVSEGGEALSVLDKSVSAQQPFDLILLDFKLPRMSGFDLARKIRKKEALKGIPIIVLTSIGRIGDGKSCIDIGIEGYLTKPVKRDEMRRAIESVLGVIKQAAPKTAPKLVTRHTIAEDNRKKVQILLAEDYPTNQQVAMRHLDKAGYQVRLAKNGKEAVEAFKIKHYDLVLMDIEMPVMDGYEATRVIRAMEAVFRKEAAKAGPADAVRTPIVAMTAHVMKDYRDKCLQAGMDDYITKPLKRKNLLAMVEKWINAQPGLRNGYL